MAMFMEGDSEAIISIALEPSLSETHLTALPLSIDCVQDLKPLSIPCEQDSKSQRHMFSRGFKERHDLEQYLWTKATVDGLIRALSYEEDLCCMATPSIAQAFYIQDGRAVRLLDIDKRFLYLPGFLYWDIRNPTPLPGGESFRVVVVDPPFFYIPMNEIHRAVVEVFKGESGQTKLLIGFLVREEGSLLKTFKDFNLKRTKFSLEYANVKPNKWKNYALYSNVDLPGIKRIRNDKVRDRP